MTNPYSLYCDVCEWSASTADGTSRAAVTNAAITHYIETTHSPVCARSYTPLPPRSHQSLWGPIWRPETQD